MLGDPRALAEQVGVAFEIAGIATIVLGALVAAGVVAADPARRRDWSGALEAYRRLLGRGILLGLEFLVAADIVRTVATAPTLENVGVLAGIVAIRTVLSIALGVEIDGRFPWQRRPERPAGGA